ncbi:hypothetical protein ACO1MK_14395, partial [Staphylococcus aureus]
VHRNNITSIEKHRESIDDTSFRPTVISYSDLNHKQFSYKDISIIIQVLFAQLDNLAKMVEVHKKI